MRRRFAAALVDVDGTLVDSTYHHALAWHRAFAACGQEMPVWKLHRHVGMGGDQLVAAVAGEAVERELGDALRRHHTEAFEQMLDQVMPLPGAHELLVALKQQRLRVVIATSSNQGHLDAFLDLVGARGLVDDWVGADDVDASRPAPDVIEAALERAGEDKALMIGDSPWDVAAASKAGLPTVCLLSGGFCRSELVEAGAVAVYESPAELAAKLDELDDPTTW